MMYDIGLKLWSTNVGAYREEAVRLFNEGVFDYLELFVVPDSLGTLADWKSLKMPFVIHNAHSAQGFNLADADCRERNHEIYLQTKAFADALNAEHIIFHGGVDGSIEETVRQLKSFDESRALLENKPCVPLPNDFGVKSCRGATEEEIGFVIAETGCGFCLDVGHAVCAAAAQGVEPYGYLKRLTRFRPAMFHLSDVADMESVHDAHPHLGTGRLDIRRVVAEVFPPSAKISVETEKLDSGRLDDFKEDVRYLRRVVDELS